MSIGTVKSPNARAGRLEKLVTRWRELAEAGYRRNGSNRAGWAEYIEQLSAQLAAQDSDTNNDLELAPYPPEHETRERQLEQGSSTAEELAPLVTALSRRQ